MSLSKRSFCRASVGALIPRAEWNGEGVKDDCHASAQATMLRTYCSMLAALAFMYGSSTIRLALGWGAAFWMQHTTDHCGDEVQVALRVDVGSAPRLADRPWTSQVFHNATLYLKICK